MINSIKNLFKYSVEKKKLVKPNKFYYVPCYKDLMGDDSLFFENPYVRRSVNVIANAVCAMKFELLDKESNEVSKGNVANMLISPNSGDTWRSFIEGLISNYMIYGNAYILLINEANDFKMHNLYSKNMNVSPQDDGSVVFRYNNHEYSNETNPYIGHFKTFNPNNHYEGISLLESIRVCASLNQNIDMHNLAIVQNGGRVSGVISLKNTGVLSEEQKNSIRQNLIENYQGAGNAGRIAIVDGDFEWKEMGSNPKDMDYSDAAKRAIRSICGCLGVPAILAGEVSEGDASRANMQVVMESFQKNTVLPLANKMVDFLNDLFWKVDNSVILKIIDEKNEKGFLNGN